MGIMDGKKGIIFGVSNKHGIANAIAEQIYAAGGEIAGGGGRGDAARVWPLWGQPRADAGSPPLLSDTMARAALAGPPALVLQAHVEGHRQRKAGAVNAEQRRAFGLCRARRHTLPPPRRSMTRSNAASSRMRPLLMAKSVSTHRFRRARSASSSIPRICCRRRR